MNKASLNNMNQNMNETGKNTIVRILGFGMIGIGLFICFYLARELLSTYNDFGSSRFVMDVTEWLNGQPEISSFDWYCFWVGVISGC